MTLGASLISSLRLISLMNEPIDNCCQKCRVREARAYNQGMRDALELLKQSAVDCLAAIDDSESAEHDAVHAPDTTAS